MKQDGEGESPDTTDKSRLQGLRYIELQASLHTEIRGYQGRYQEPGARHPSRLLSCGNAVDEKKKFNKKNMYIISLQVFVFLLSFLVTVQQALSSGYINSVITTIEKRFEIPSSLSGLIASSYEIGNVITVIFVSYLGSRRHIPVWIAIGQYI